MLFYSARMLIGIFNPVGSRAGWLRTPDGIAWTCQNLEETITTSGRPKTNGFVSIALGGLAHLFVPYDGVAIINGRTDDGVCQWRR